MVIPSLYDLPEVLLLDTDTPIVLSSKSDKSLTILVSMSSKEIELTLPTTSFKGTGYFEEITTISSTSSSAYIKFVPTKKIIKKALKRLLISI